METLEAQGSLRIRAEVVIAPRWEQEEGMFRASTPHSSVSDLDTGLRGESWGCKFMQQKLLQRAYVWVWLCFGDRKKWELEEVLITGK